MNILPKRLGAVILARMDSRRLPGKVIADISGQPLLYYIVNQIPSDVLSCAPILATTDREVDSPLVDVAQALGLSVYRGSEKDVAGRVLATAKYYNLQGVFRINGDSPFLSPDLIRQAASVFRENSYDLVTNLQERTYPYGVAVELLFPEAVLKCLNQHEQAGDREHVTSCLYREPGSLMIHNILDPGQDINGSQTRIRLTIDTAKDLRMFRRYISEKLTSGIGSDEAFLSYAEALQTPFFSDNEP